MKSPQTTAGEEKKFASSCDVQSGPIRLDPPLLVVTGSCLPQSDAPHVLSLTPLCYSPLHDRGPSSSVVSCGSKAGGTLMGGKEALAKSLRSMSQIQF